METISPELALVDEQLGSSARGALPDAPDCLVCREVQLERTAASRARRRPTVAIAGGALVALSVALAAFALPRETEPQANAGAPASADSRQAGSLRPAEGPAQLRWRPVRGAAFYNVIFWRDGVRALDLWPRTAEVPVPRGRLDRGRYRWFVYPALGTSADRRYGPIAAQGTLRV